MSNLTVSQYIDDLMASADRAAVMAHLQIPYPVALGWDGKLEDEDEDSLPLPHDTLWKKGSSVFAAVDVDPALRVVVSGADPSGYDGTYTEAESGVWLLDIGDPDGHRLVWDGTDTWEAFEGESPASADGTGTGGTIDNPASADWGDFATVENPSVVIEVAVGATTLGLLTITSAGVITWTEDAGITEDLDIDAGDVIRATGPATADADLAGVRITLPLFAR